MAIRQLLLVVFALGLGVIFPPSARAQQSPPPSSDPAPAEFRQIAPDARKLIVEEIHLQLATEDRQRFDDLTARAETWMRIAAGAIAAFGALLAFFGWRGLSGIRTDIRRDLVEFIRDDVRFQAELSSKLRQASAAEASLALEKGRREISFARLEYLARKVAESEQFSEADVFVLKELLLSVKDDPEITGTEAFKLAAYQVIRSLYGADLDRHVDELETQLRSVFVKWPSICGQLIDCYGERMLEKDSPSTDVVERFELYADAAEKAGATPWALPYKLAFMCHTKPDGWSKQTDTALKQIRYMNEEHRKWLADAIKRRAESSAPLRTYRQERERELLMEFYTQYRDKLDKACAERVSA